MNVLSVVGDNRCRWNLSALLKSTGLKQEDILFAQFQPEVRLTCWVLLYILLFGNAGVPEWQVCVRLLTYLNIHLQVYLPAFFVAVDHKEKAVVISVCGTKSLVVSWH